uniref:Alpha-( )-fucosyltransferase n=2 Tax=Tetraselmis sp. GSL018 TaxID=582737 RepID=A0A061RIG9_9CHLO
MQSGLGSTLMLISAALSDALYLGKMFLPPRNSHFASSSRKCKNHPGFECFFKPWAVFPRSCKVQIEALKSRIGGASCNNSEDKCSRMHLVPAPYESRGRFWWRSNLMKYLVQTNVQFRQSLDLESLRAKIGLSKRSIGVHVRRGDSCFLARAGYCKTFRDYIPAIETAAWRYNISRVFIATDSPSVITELEQNPVDGLEFVHLPMNRGSFDVQKPSQGSGWKMSVEKRVQRGELSGHSVVLSAVRDILLLAESDVLIGTGSASFFKLALLLSAAGKKRMPPYISLDSPYCDSWRMCCDVAPDGSKETC